MNIKFSHNSSVVLLDGMLIPVLTFWFKRFVCCSKFRRIRCCFNV